MPPLMSGISGTETAPLARRLRLEPGPGNPRNSEGDFLLLKDGRWMLVYSHFLGSSSSDFGHAELAARFSSDGGQSWTDRDVIVVPNEGGMNVMSVTLRRLPAGEIGLFYCRKNSLDDCRPVLRRSRDEARTWGPPEEIITERNSEIGYFVVNNDRVTILRSGRIVIPAALHKGTPGKFNGVGRVHCYLSDDNGKSWRRSKTVLSLPVPASHTGLQEPGVLELKDGRLLLWARTDQGTQWYSYSEDGGETWSPVVPGNLRSPAAPASLKRIPGTGDVLAVWDDAPAGAPRTPLAIALSRDECRTWTRPLLLESDPSGWYCYTALDFAPGETGRPEDANLLLAYCAGTRGRDGLAPLQVSTLPLRQTFYAKGGNG